MAHPEPRDIHLQSSQNARLGNSIAKARDANRQVQSPIARFGEWTAQARNQLQRCSQGSVLASAQARNSSLSSLVCAFCFCSFDFLSVARARELCIIARPPACPSSVRIATTIAICPGLFLTFSDAFLTLVFPNKTRIPFCLFWILIGRLRYSVFSSSATCSSLLRMRTIFFLFFFFPFFSFLFFSFPLWVIRKISQTVSGIPRLAGFQPRKKWSARRLMQHSKKLPRELEASNLEEISSFVGSFFFVRIMRQICAFRVYRHF